MHVISARNVHCALPHAIELVVNQGRPRNSRNGPVLAAHCPVTTMYGKPCERVMFWRERDANPFFHLMESLWMLAGRSDVAFVAQFAKRMKDYSDDGKTLHGAYGYRWRKHFATDSLDYGKVDHIDQLAVVIEQLKRNPEDRRAVVCMWDPEVDCGATGKDLPCNMIIHFEVNMDGALDMKVFNRSNDIIWGCYGANAVHMSMLQEYMAAGIGVPVGYYWQISSNWHAYVDTLEPLLGLVDQAPDPFRAGGIKHDFYTQNVVEPFPLVSTPIKDWGMDLALFMEDPTSNGFRDPFFSKVAKPMFMAHKAFKTKISGTDDYSRFLNAQEILKQMPTNNDWQLAAADWVDRRHSKAFEAAAVADGGSQHADETT